MLSGKELDATLIFWWIGNTRCVGADGRKREEREREGHDDSVPTPIIGSKSIGFIRTISIRGKRRGFPGSASNPNEVFLAFIRFPLTVRATVSRRNH